MRNPLNQTITEIKPSGIRKFFDIVAGQFPMRQQSQNDIF